MSLENAHKLQRVTVTPEQHSGTTVTLTAEQQHYLLRVLRLQAGDRFIATTGRGQAWLAQLTELKPFVL